MPYSSGGAHREGCGASDRITGRRDATAAAHSGAACAFPGEASTLHRLLGAQPGSQRLRYHAGNPLHLDVLVVDEASMIDLTMMSRLIDALPPHARVVFWAIATSSPL